MALTEGIKRLKTLINILAKPLTVPPFLAGTGGALSANRIISSRGVRAMHSARNPRL